MDSKDLKNIQIAFKEISIEMVNLMKMVMDSNIGINKKTDENTLKDSDVKKSLKEFVSSVTTDNVVVGFLANEYIEYINSGRKKGKFMPLQPLISWMKKKGIPTDNNTVYAINYSIYKKGIQGRPINFHFYNWIDTKYWDKWSDKIFESVLKILDKQFIN